MKCQPICDVAGCPEPAEWRLSVTIVANVQRCLCDRHYERLCRTHPQLAGHYLRPAHPTTDHNDVQGYAGLTE